MKGASKEARADLVRAIVRMSQKALGWTLATMFVGYIGGLITICFDPELSGPLSQYAEVYTPVFQLEIGVYGLGSTLEQLQKIKTKIDSLNKEDPVDAQKNTDTAAQSDGCG